MGDKILQGISKAAVPVALVVDGGIRVNSSAKTERLYQSGKISSREREVAHAGNAAGMAGGWGGAFAGAELGAMGGAAAGSAVAPGPGSVVGGIVGGIAGGVAGYIGGEAAAKTAAKWAVTEVHDAGASVSETANKAWRWLTGD